MMSTVALTQNVAAAQLAVTRQGDTVRSLKASLKEGKAEKVSTGDLCSMLNAAVRRRHGCIELGQCFPTPVAAASPWPGLCYTALLLHIHCC